MGTTLDNGIYLPDEGERNCYEGLAGNWVALDNHLGSTNIHVTINDKQAWDGHVADTTIHVTSADKQAWNGKADASALTAHTGDTTIHVTAEDKQAWNGHVADSVKHVTAEDKNKWDAVTSKADDSDVVHKSGDETVGGEKTFNNVVPINGGYIGNEPSTSFRTVLLLRSRYDTAGKSGWLVSKFRSNSAQGALSGSDTVFMNFDVLENEVRTNGILRFNLSSWSGNVPGRFSLIPNANVESFLGTTGNKWSTINGLTPSSLSLPSDINSRIDISSYFTNTGTGQSNSYTVPANGYIYLTLSELTNVNCFSRSSGNVTNYAQTFTKLSNSTGALYILFPVRKNDVFVATWYTTTTVSVDGAFFIPCKGNI